MFNTLHSDNVVKIMPRHIKGLGMGQSLSSAKVCKPSTTKPAEPKASFSAFLDDSYHGRSQSVDQKEAMAVFLAEHLTYCDELIEYLLADKKALKQCADSLNEDLAVLKLAAQAITDKLGNSNKAKRRSFATKLRKAN